MTLDAATLEKALKDVATYIKKHGRELTIVAVGGAVNCMALRTRDTTHDFDFFNNRFGPKDYELFAAAAASAQKKTKQLDTGWLNNRTVVFMPIDLRDSLTDEAIRQNDIVFNSPGLRVLAAPWNYALCCKIDRIAGSGITSKRPYDLDGAVAYLRRYLSRLPAGPNEKRIPKAEIIAWMARFGLQRSSALPEFEIIIAAINQKLGYQAIF